MCESSASLAMHSLRALNLAVAFAHGCTIERMRPTRLVRRETVRVYTGGENDTIVDRCGLVQHVILGDSVG